MKIGILDIAQNKCVSWYTSDRVRYKAPYADTTKYIHYQVADGRYPEGYYLDAGNNLVYDLNYAPPSNTYIALTKEKLKSITAYVESISLDFASENSEIMALAGYTDTQKATAVQEVVDAFKPIEEQIRMFNYYPIWTMFDNITRSGILLTDERINAYKAKLYTFIFGG